MSQLRQFLQRNLHGRQTLKPVVRSYYAHSPTTKQGYSRAGSDSVTNEGISNIAGTDEVQGEISSDGFGSLNDTSNPRSRTHSPHTASHASGDGVEPQTPKTADNSQRIERRGIEPARIQQADQTAEQRTEASLSFPSNPKALHLSAADHSTADFGGEVTPQHANHIRDSETLTAHSRSNPSEGKVPPVGNPAKRRDFTREVAASIFSPPLVSDLRNNPDSAASRKEQMAGQTSHVNHDVSVSVTIREVNIVPPAAPVKEKPSWQPPKSLSQYLSEREGKR